MICAHEVFSFGFLTKPWNARLHESNIFTKSSIEIVSIPNTKPSLKVLTNMNMKYDETGGSRDGLLLTSKGRSKHKLGSRQIFNYIHMLLLHKKYFYISALRLMRIFWSNSTFILLPVLTDWSLQILRSHIWSLTNTTLLGIIKAPAPSKSTFYTTVFINVRVGVIVTLKKDAINIKYTVNFLSLGNYTPHWISCICKKGGKTICVGNRH